MNPIPFLQPRLTGKRFEGHAIPLEFLKDLAVLEEMIIEVAKWKYLQNNSDRVRVPRGFTEGIELRLTGLNEGSAIPVIGLFVAASVTSFPPDNQAYFEEARNSIVCAISAAEKDESILNHLPDKALGYFDRLGRSLRDGEAFEFTTPIQTIPARLTKEIRRKLVLASTNIKELTEETTVRGAIPEVDQDDMTFEIQMIDGYKAKAPLPSQHLETILEAFTGYKKGIRVFLQGIGKFNRQERLLGFESIEHVGILDPLDVPARLDEFRKLKDGWLEGRGLTPRPTGLDWLASTFELNFPDELQLPYVYPTAEGGIQMEWSIESNESTLEIDLEKQAGIWHSLNMSVDQEETKRLDLNTTNGWQWLVDKIKNLTGGIA